MSKIDTIRSPPSIFSGFTLPQTTSSDADAKLADAKKGEGALLVVNGDRVEEDFAEEQRQAMRVALAQRMKRELIESEQERFAKVSKTNRRRHCALALTLDELFLKYPPWNPFGTKSFDFACQ